MRCGSGLEAELRDIQVANAWSHTVPTIVTRSCNRYSRTCRAEMIRLIMECHEGAEPPQATLLIETPVEVPMSTFGRTQLRISADDADQPFLVAGSSRAEGRCCKSKHNSPHPEHNLLREGGVTRERKSQRHSERCRARFEILCAAVPEEGESKPRRRSNLHSIQKWRAQRQGQQQPSSAEQRD